MLLNSDLIELLAAFEKFKVTYLAIGGYAVGYHAEPRYTKDLDVWIDTDRKNSYAVFKALAEYGAPLSGGPDMFQDQDSIYWVGFAPNRVDILMAPEGAPQFKDAWRRRVKAAVGDVHDTVVSRQHLIALKELANRAVDRRDIKALRASAPVAVKATRKVPPTVKQALTQSKKKRPRKVSPKRAR